MTVHEKQTANEAWYEIWDCKMRLYTNEYFGTVKLRKYTFEIDFQGLFLIKE